MSCYKGCPILIQVFFFMMPFFQYQLASARAPLQAKIEDMEDAMERLQDKFNKAKAENDRVSYLFSLRASRHTKVSRRDYVSKTKGCNINNSAIWTRHYVDAGRTTERSLDL